MFPRPQGHPHVAVAAVHGHEAVLDLLCACGGGVTLKALHHATDMRSIRVRGLHWWGRGGALERSRGRGMGSPPCTCAAKAAELERLQLILAACRA